MSVSQIIVDICPEMGSLDSATLGRLISYSSPQVALCFGQLRNLAIANLTAHSYIVGQRSAGGGASGPLTSIKEGDLAKGFGTTSVGSAGASLSQTGYGLEFLRLRRSVMFAARTRAVDGC